MNSTDIVVIILYLLAIFSVGLAFTRRAHKNTDSYFLSGRNLPWWVAGTSMVATSFSCDTPLYVTKLVRSEGIHLNWQWWSFAIGGLFGAFFLSRLWRRANIVTDVELTELRYGGKAGRILRIVRAGWLSLLVNTIAMSWVVLAMAKIIGVVWGGPKWTGVMIASSLAVVYSLFAGFWGVVVTDVAQFVIALIGAVILAVIAVNAAGGMENIIAVVGIERLSMIPQIPEAGIFSLESLSGAFGGFIIYISIQWWANLNSDGGGKVIQRMSASKNEAHAFGATLWYNIAHFAIRTWPWVIVAMASLVLIPEIADDELAYPRLIIELLPAGLRGLLIAGLFAAFMSTIDTQLNWGASYLTHDIYRGWLVPGKSEKHYLVAAKISMIVLIGFTSLMAYKVQSVTEAFKFIIAFGAGTGPVYILRWFWWRISAWSEISAMLASSLISSSLYLFWPEVSFPVKVLMVTLGSAIIFLPVTFLTPAPKKKTLLEFYRRTTPPGNWNAIKSSITNDPEISVTGKNNQSLLPEVIGWLGGIALTLGSTFAIGSFCLARPVDGIILTAVAIVGGYVTYRWMKLRLL